VVELQDDEALKAQDVGDLGIDGVMPSGLRAADGDGPQHLTLLTRDH
jgi:hypothetical protein